MTSLREHEALHVPGIVLQDAQVGIDHTSLAWSLRRVTTEGVGFGAQGLFRPTDKKLARPVLAKARNRTPNTGLPEEALPGCRRASSIDAL